MESGRQQKQLNREYDGSRASTSTSTQANYSHFLESVNGKNALRYGKMQTTLDGEVALKNQECICETRIRDVATKDYLDYLKRCGISSARCPECEIDFVSIVFSLSDKTQTTLRQRWLKNGGTGRQDCARELQKNVP